MFQQCIMDIIFRTKCTELQDIAHTVSKFVEGNMPGHPPAPRPRCLDPNSNFRLSRQRSHCSCFTKWRVD